MLRNMLFIALALDSTQQEIDNAHDTIDKFFGAGGDTIAPSQVQTGDAAAGTATTTGVTLDKNGLPWDERIHASSKALTDKNEWRAKRGVSADLKAKVEGELRATMGGTAAASAPPTPPAAAAATPPLPGAGLPPLPGANVQPATDPVYAELLDVVAKNTKSAENPNGRIEADWLKSVLTHYGVADGSLQNAAHNPKAVADSLAFVKQALGL